MSSSLKLPSALLAALAALALTTADAPAADGVPDPGFDGDGRVVHQVQYAFPGFPADMAIDSRGRIVVLVGAYVKYFATLSVVARFNPDGSLDQSFGREGVAGAGEGFAAVAIDGAGRIVLGGNKGPEAINSDFVIARLLENGQPDLAFADNGVLTVDTGSKGDYGSALALDGRDGILLAGRTKIEEPGGTEATRMALLRVTAAGVPDSGFDEDGVALASFGDPGDFGEESEAGAIAVDSRGRILAAGTTRRYGSHEFALAGFDGQGHPDPTVGGDGTATIDFDSTIGFLQHEEVVNDIALDPQGRIVLAGADGRASALAARLLPDGGPDPSFGGDGTIVLPLPGAAVGAAAAVDGAGRPLIAGNLVQGESRSAFLARLGQDGSLDGSFGTGGFVSEDFLSNIAIGDDVAVDSAGRYLLMGRAYESDQRLGLARYLNGVQPPAGQVGRCRGKRATIAGTAGPDRLRGTRGRDVIAAFAGNDRVRALGGRDLVCAGRGRDLVRAGAGNDKVFGGRGNDRLFGGPGKDRLRGGPGRDVER